MSGVDEEIIQRINEALVRSGEKENLKQMVREKLTQSGWLDQVRMEAEREAQARNLDGINPHELASILIPKATAMVPPQVRQQIEAEVTRFLDTHIKLA